VNVAFFNIDRKLGLLLIPKCASSAIHNSVAASGLWHSEINVDQFRDMPLRVAFLRDPHKRIESCWRMYSVTGSSRDHDLSDFNSFVRGVCLDTHDDPHVISQWRHCTNDDNFLPNKVLRWDFDEMAKLLGVDRIPQYHATYLGIKTEWDESVRDLFDQVFAEDLKLWGKNGKGTRQLDD
jgi:hypothetical protein